MWITELQMIGADAAHTVTYLCELFCRWLTLRAQHFASVDGRRTLQLHDLVAGAISSDQFDFLCDHVHMHGNVEAEYERQQQIELELRLRLSRAKPLEGTSLSTSSGRPSRNFGGAAPTCLEAEECDDQLGSLDDADIDRLIDAVEARSALSRSTRAGASGPAQNSLPSDDGTAPAPPEPSDAAMHDHVDDKQDNFSPFYYNLPANQRGGFYEDSAVEHNIESVEFTPLNENERAGLSPDIADLPAEWSMER